MTLQAKNLSYRTRTGEVLVDSINMELKSGEVVGVLGPNGAGKTTLLKMLSGELAPTSGEVRIAGERLPELAHAERALHVAVLPQAGTLTFPYPVIDIVLLGRLPHRHRSSARTDRRIAFRCLEQVEAEHLAERSYPTLSGGEKQRVQLARILAQLESAHTENLSEKYLLLDEPTSALDLSHQHQVLESARSMASRGAGVLAILHDLNLASQYTDRLLVLHGGKAAAEGPAGVILEPVMIQRVYGVEAVINNHPRLGCPLVSTTGKKEVLSER